jgi:hypothetical protein
LLGKTAWYDELPNPVPFGVKFVEADGVCRATPRLLPTKWLILWIINGDIVFTCMILIHALRQENVVSPNWTIWVFLLSMWFVTLPGVFGFFYFFNRRLSRHGDYFRVGRNHRTLELCRIGRTLKAGDIIAFTELTRWHRRHRYAGKWQKTHQTGVLTRKGDRQTELYPLIHEREAPVLWWSLPLYRHSSWAERLANIFQVPVRRIELSRSESRHLNDC